MKNTFIFIILYFMSISPAFAEENVYSIMTPGKAELEINTNYILFSTGKTYPAEIPIKITEGNTLRVRYKDKNSYRQTELFAGCIQYREKGNLCWVSEECKSLTNRLIIRNCRPIQ